MEPSKRFSLAFARKCCDKLVPWLEPFCLRLQVAGSVRRKCPTIGDIDLVCIPKTRDVMDIFGEPTGETENLLGKEIHETCKEKGWVISKDGPQCIIFESAGVQVDIWMGKPTNWGTLLMCRTGSKEHNIWLAMGAEKRGGRWNPHDGLRLGGYNHAGTEEDIYKALGVPFLPPEARNCNFPFIRP